MAQTSEHRPAELESWPLKARAGYLSVQLGDLVMRRVEAALLPLGLKPREYDVMACILAGHGLSQQELSRSLGVYAPGLVGVIDGLERRGLVARQRSGQDRRRYVLSLTAAGASLLDQANAVVSALDARVFGILSASDKAALEALLRQVLTAREVSEG
ncbi:MarR family winged helix-turn-helix transcriptional regulator [Deinococcus sp.]|uniref:MarR family winged helix-turn-helix transcriptional regulator n=1 Tax=Deinococcus sp. TaxID=47478 RepID=UPI003B5A96A0